MTTKDQAIAPVDQTIMHSATSQGNCMQAAVASLLHLPIEAVPHFAESGDAYTCWTSFEDWLNAAGYEVWLMPTKMLPDCPYLASGPTSRGTSHMVVMHGAKLLHDPHPSRAGILKVERAQVLLPKSYAAQPPAPDCRTCADYDRLEGCLRAPRYGVCTNGDQYQPAPQVVLWRTE